MEGAWSRTVDGSRRQGHVARGAGAWTSFYPDGKSWRRGLRGKAAGAWKLYHPSATSRRSAVRSAASQRRGVQRHQGAARSRSDSSLAGSVAARGDTRRGKVIATSRVVGKERSDLACAILVGGAGKAASGTDPLVGGNGQPANHMVARGRGGTSSHDNILTTAALMTRRSGLARGISAVAAGKAIAPRRRLELHRLLRANTTRRLALRRQAGGLQERATSITGRSLRSCRAVAEPGLREESTAIGRLDEGCRLARKRVRDGVENARRGSRARDRGEPVWDIEGSKSTRSSPVPDLPGRALRTRLERERERNPDRRTSNQACLAHKRRGHFALVHSAGPACADGVGARADLENSNRKSSRCAPQTSRCPREMPKSA